MLYSGVAITSLTEDNQLMEQILQKSLPLKTSLRFKMIEKIFVYKNHFPIEFIKQIVDEDKEKNIKSFAAINYYQEINKSNQYTDD